MTVHPKFSLGDDVYVREPQRFDPACTCRIGIVKEYELREDGYWYSFANKGYPATGEWVWHKESELGLRVGTSISQLSGRPGHAGYDQFCAIARSWGHD